MLLKYVYIYIGMIGLYWDNGKEIGNYRDHRVYIGVILGHIGVIDIYIYRDDRVI